MIVSWVVSSIRQPAGSHYSETREEKTEKEEKQNFATPGMSETQEVIIWSGEAMRIFQSHSVHKSRGTSTRVAAAHPFVDCDGNTDSEF